MSGASGASCEEPVNLEKFLRMTAAVGGPVVCAEGCVELQ